MTLRSLGILRAKDMPPVDVILVEEPQPRAPYGIKGVGRDRAGAHRRRRRRRPPRAGTAAGARTLPMRAPAPAAAGLARTATPTSRGGSAPPTATSDGLVCGHHHLYSALARGMPAPPRTPTSFTEILELVWWRLDARPRPRDDPMVGDARRRRGAGVRARPSIIDHHASPERHRGLARRDPRRLHRGRRADRHLLRGHRPPRPRRHAGRAGRERALHPRPPRPDRLASAPTPASPCRSRRLEAGRRPGCGPRRRGAHPCGRGPGRRRRGPAPGAAMPTTPGCWRTPCTSTGPSPGPSPHNPRSNLNNAVGYARPDRFGNPVRLGTDGIGADMLEEFRLAFVCLRAERRDRDAADDRGGGWRATPGRS